MYILIKTMAIVGADDSSCMVEVDWLDLRVSGRLALFYIHQMYQINSQKFDFS